MKRKVKRLLSMLMVVVMLLGMLPTGIAFAQDGEYNNSETAFNDTAVQATKTVSGPDNDRNYTITLNVKGDTTTSTEMQNVPADIVLVVDTSTSMEYKVDGTKICGGKIEEKGWLFHYWYECSNCGEKYDANNHPEYCTATISMNRLDVAKSAAKNFVNSLMNEGNDVRIGLYDFSGSNRTNVKLTGVNGKNTLLQEINDLHCPDNGDGTSYTEGLRGAQNILNESTNGRAKFIVFISDGEPNNGNTGINIANQLKQNDVTIFTVGVDLRDNQAGDLKVISSKYKDDSGKEQYRYYSASTSGSSNALNAILEEIRKEIQKNIPAGSDAVMTDVINTNSFEYVDGSASAGLTVDNDKSTLTWKIGDISKDSKSVSFKIKLKEDNTADGSLKTNSNVSLTFQSNKLNKEVTFNKGAIGDPTVDVYKVTYTDGVPDKEIFADQTTCNLVSGDPTPDFDGTTPTREGYTFSGWSPYWSSTVTETVTYEAQWTPIPQYTVTYDLNGGTGTTPDSATGYENTSVTVANDEKFENPGYTFSGWNTEKNGTGTDYAAGSSLILTRNVTLYAQWNPSENTRYKVEHYWQNVENDEYTLHETKTMSGTTGTETAAEANTYPGFTDKSFEQTTIAADGSTVVKIYYDRNKYTIYYQITGDNLTEKNTIVADDGKKYFKIVNDVKYGAKTALITGNMDVGGYLWSGWSGLIGESMPAQDVYVTGSYSPATDTKYTVHHYIQNVDLNGYTEAQSSPVTLTGVTGETTNATAWNITGFTAQSFAQQEIQADGSTVIDIYYNRNLHKVTYQITGNYFTSASYIVQENIPYGQALSLISDEMGKTGYTWSGWGGLPQTMPDNDVTVTGSYTANANTQYKVKHYQQNLDGTYPDSPTTTETLYGTTDTEVTATPNKYEGFTYDGDAAGTVASGTILGDGTLVLKLFYSRNTHKVTYNLNGGTGATGGDYAEKTYRYGQEVTVQPAPTRDYRQFQGWQRDTSQNKVDPNSTFIMPDNDVNFTATWDAENYPGGGGTTPNPPALNTEDHFSYVVGYEDGMVKPENAITRAEVASIFYRLLKDDVRDANTTDVSEFSDVSASDWYGTTVATLSAMDIVRGYEDGTFRPNAPITRAEFAAIATRFFEETGAEYEPGTFDDVTGDEWFANAIADAVELGLIGGYPDGTVRPNNNITRAEACAIVNRTLGRIPHVDHLLPADEMTTWPDNNPSDWFYADMQEATNGHEYEWTTEQGQKVEEWTEILDKDWEDR